MDLAGDAKLQVLEPKTPKLAPKLVLELVPELALELAILQPKMQQSLEP